MKYCPGKPLYLALLILSSTSLCLGFQFIGSSEKELSPSAARDHRAAAKYHYVKANEAQNKMGIAEREDDVDSYERWLKKMRKHDQEMWDAINKYLELRDYLEARIWTGEMEIKNFRKIYEKSTAASILDHLTFRAKI